MRDGLAAEGQPQLGAGAALAIGPIVQRYGALMALDHLAYQTQPQPGTLAGVGAGQGVEALEQAPESKVGNAGSLIQDGQQLVTGCQNPALQLDVATRRGEVDGVIQQVGDGLAEQQGIGLDLSRL